jgi:hypothetical protein
LYLKWGRTLSASEYSSPRLNNCSITSSSRLRINIACTDIYVFSYNRKTKSSGDLLIIQMVPRDKKSELLQKLERQNINLMYRINDILY